MMQSDDTPMRDDEYSFEASLRDWLARAKDVLSHVRENYGQEPEQEILAEIGFYERLLELYATGEVRNDQDSQPPSAVVLRSTLDAIEHRIERTQESIDMHRDRGEVELAETAAATSVRLRLLRDYVLRTDVGSEGE